MAGNSQRRGAIRKGGKGPTVGSGGQRRRGLEGKGPTPKAAERDYHPATSAPQRRPRPRPAPASGGARGRSRRASATAAQGVAARSSPAATPSSRPCAPTSP